MRFFTEVRNHRKELMFVGATLIAVSMGLTVAKASSGGTNVTLEMYCLFLGCALFAAGVSTSMTAEISFDRTNNV